MKPWIVGGLAMAALLALPAAALAAFIYLAPAPVLASLPAWFPHPGRKLGLHEVGGSYLVLQLDTGALKTEAETNLVDDVRGVLRMRQIDFSDLGATDDGASVRITDPGRVEDARQALALIRRTVEHDAAPLAAVSAGPGQTLRLTMNNPLLVEGSIEQAINILRRRLTALDVRASTVTSLGAGRVAVEAPGAIDPQRLREALTVAGVLNFQLVDDSIAVEDVENGALPPADVRVVSVDPSCQNRCVMVLQRRVIARGADIDSATQGFDQMIGQPDILFRFNSQGARRFAEATTDNVGKRFAIVLDGKVIEAPMIEAPITGGQGQITGSFTVESARQLALLLATGALPAPMSVVEQRKVAPGG